jgi:ketosteroid isomerase-like protein
MAAPEDSFDQTAELVTRLIDEIRHGDLDCVLALADPDIELRSWLGAVEGGVYHGHAGVREWFRDVIETFAPLDPGLTGVEDAGGTAIATGHARGRARSSGVELEWDWVAMVRAPEGKVVQFSVYRDRDELRRAEGV